MASGSPQDLDYFLPYLSISDIKMKITIGSRLIAYLEDPSNSIECSDFGMFIDDIIQWLSSQVPKVSLRGNEILTLLITRTRRDFRQFISNLLPLVINQLGDNNKELKSNAHNLLVKLMECDSISPQRLFDKIIELNAFNHKNNNVKGGIMTLLVSTIVKFGSNSVIISKIVPLIVRLLSDSNAQVRQKASETLVHLYKNIGEPLRIDIQKIQKNCIIPQNISKELMLKFDKARPNITMHHFESPLPYGRYLINDKKPDHQNPDFIDENTFNESFEEVPWMQISNGRELNDIMKKLHASIKNPKEIWNKRVDSLKQIRSLVLMGATKYEEFFNNLQYIQQSFQVSIKDLRALVVRETCITIAFLAQSLGNRFNHFAEQIFMSLIDLIPKSKTVFASCGLIAAKFILKYIHTYRILSLIVTRLGFEKSKSIRRACCEFINQIMCTWHTQILERHVPTLQNAIKKGLTDADQKAREWSRKNYQEFCKHFPEKGEILSKTLDSSHRKQLPPNTGSKSSIQNFLMAENQKLPSRNEFPRQRSRSVIDLQYIYKARDRIQNCRPTRDLNHLERIGRPQKRDSLSQPSSRSGSPISSMGSESTISYNDPPTNFVNWDGSQSQLSQDTLENTLDIDDIISNCESSNWDNCRKGLENLAKYLHQGYIINEELLKKFTDIFGKILMDSQTKDIILCLEVLNDLIDTHSQYLEFWVFTLLSKLFNKRGSDILGSVESRLLKTMDKIRLLFPYDVQLTAVFKFLTNQSQTLNTKMKIYALNYLTKLTDTIDRGSMTSCTDTDERKYYADLALKNIMEWDVGDKINQTPEVCKAIEETLAALHNLNSSEGTSRLCEVPDVSQGSDYNKLITRKLSLDQLISPKSSKSVIRKPFENIFQNERIGRSKNRISSSQPSSRSGSPSSRSTYTERNSKRGLSGIPRSRGNREVSPNRYNYQLQSSSKQPLLLSTSKSLISQKILTPSRETESALADAFRSTSSRRKLYNYSNEDLTSDIFYEPSSNYHKESSNLDYLNELKQTTDKICNITKCLDYNFTEEKDFSSREIDKTIRDEIIKILDNLGKNTLSLDNKQLNLNRLDKILKNISCDVILNNLKQIIQVVLKLLTDNEPTIREQAVLWIIFLIQKPDLITYFFSFTEPIILNVLEMSNDDCQSVVKVSEECAYILSTALQPETVVKVITPLISTKKFPINLLAIRMITKIVDKNGSYPVAAQMKEIMPSLLQAYDDRDSTVRKSAVFCMVALYKVIDKQEFSEYVSSLNGPKLKLLDLYIERTQNSSTFSNIN